MFQIGAFSAAKSRGRDTAWDFENRREAEAEAKQPVQRLAAQQASEMLSYLCLLIHESIQYFGGFWTVYDMWCLFRVSRSILIIIVQMKPQCFFVTNMSIPSVSAQQWSSASTACSQLRTGLNIELNYPQNLERLVLGCIDSYDSESRRILQLFSRSTRLACFCTAQTSKIRIKISHNFFQIEYWIFNGNFSFCPEKCYFSFKFR